jgi:ribose 5-phosphate isomerase B
MKIAIGADHSAVDLKQVIITHLKTKNIEVINLGTDDKTATDYPFYAEKVSKAIQNHEADAGILICGTGIGMSMAANKFEGIRAASVSEPFSAKASKEHNNANVLCFGARVVGDELAKMIVDSYLEASFQEGRHQTRVDMISSFE